MNECMHHRIEGDNYGATCMDCGEVLEGYGFFGSGTGICKHVWQPFDENHEQCKYCEEIRLKEAENG